MGEHHAGSADRGEWVDLAGSFETRGGPADRLEHRDAVGVEIGSGGDAHTSLNRGSEVGDDVAEHVVGHDHVETARVFDHPETRRVDVGVGGGHLRVFLGHGLEYPCPEVPCIGEDVRLPAHGQMTAGSRPRQFECVPDTALHAETAVYRLLDGHLERRSLGSEFTGTDVEAFAVLTHHDHVDIGRLDITKRPNHPWMEFDRPQIDVQVELLAESEDDLLLEDPRCHFGMSNGAEQDGVDARERLEVCPGQGLPGSQISLAANLVMGVFDLEVEHLRGSVNRLDRLGHDFGTCPVPGHYGNAVSGHW